MFDLAFCTFGINKPLKLFLVDMERYCPNENCGADLTAQADKVENWISSPGKMFEGVFCLECGRVVMPTATRDLYWKSKA